MSQLLVCERTNQHDGIHVDLGQRRHGRRNCERKLRSKELRRRSRRHGEPRCRFTGSTLGALGRRTRALDLLQQHLCRSVRSVTKGSVRIFESMTNTVGIWAGLRWHPCVSVRTGPLNSPAHRQRPRSLPGLSVRHRDGDAWAGGAEPVGGVGGDALKRVGPVGHRRRVPLARPSGVRGIRSGNADRLIGQGAATDLEGEIEQSGRVLALMGWLVPDTVAPSAGTSTVAMGGGLSTVIVIGALVPLSPLP